MNSSIVLCAVHPFHNAGCRDFPRLCFGRRKIIVTQWLQPNKGAGLSRRLNSNPPRRQGAAKIYTPVRNNDFPYLFGVSHFHNHRFKGLAPSSARRVVFKRDITSQTFLIAIQRLIYAVKHLNKIIAGLCGGTVEEVGRSLLRNCLWCWLFDDEFTHLNGLCVWFTGKWCPRREWSSPPDARAASDAARRGVLYSSVFLGSPGKISVVVLLKRVKWMWMDRCTEAIGFAFISRSNLKAQKSSVSI